MADTFSDREAGSIVQPCPAAARPGPQSTHWIEIELVGEDGTPLPWFEYEVTLPDGQKVRGYLNEDGLARIENIETPGTAQVRFTTLDQEAWTPVASQGG